MKILYFGDTFGKPGRDAVKLAIRKHQMQHMPDFIIVNGENFAHGNGILPEMADEFFNDHNVDVITLGNHAWDQRQIIPYIENQPRLLRPANYPEHPNFPVPGKGHCIVQSRRDPDLKLGVLQVMGRVFMDSIDCPFEKADEILKEFEDQGVISVFADFHGEASSEKQAFAFYLEGRASAVVGSHSHVQTADERILMGGTAAITDVGMCGCYDSIIGVKKEVALQKLITKRPIKFEPAEGPGGYGAVLIEVNENTGRASQITRFRETVIS